MKIAYVVMRNSDQTEGKGPMYLLDDAVFIDSNDASQVQRTRKKNSGVWIEDEIREVLIFDNFREYREYLDGKVRAKALAKLSDEEKKVLGVK